MTDAGAWAIGREMPKLRASRRIMSMTVSEQVVARLAGVEKRYGRLVALDNAGLQLRRGELLALLGLLRADAGTVELFGRDPRDVRARRRIGVMLQHAELPGTLRVGELLRLI